MHTISFVKCITPQDKDTCTHCLFKCFNDHAIGTINTWDHYNNAGVDLGFLQRGFIRINVWGFALLILSHFP